MINLSIIRLISVRKNQSGLFLVTIPIFNDVESKKEVDSEVLNQPSKKCG